MSYQQIREENIQRNLNTVETEKILPDQNKNQIDQKKKNNQMNLKSSQFVNTYSYFSKLFANDSVQIDLKTFIKQLKQRNGISREKIIQLIDIVDSMLKNQSNVLKLSSPITIVGDIHGQFYDLLNIFQLNGFPSKRNYIFLGDYVDRGFFCIEVITLLLILKLKYKKNIFLLRGNHEGRVMTSNFNFKIQCQKKYGIEIYEKFLDLFCKLPLCAIIDQSFFAVHGGISPELSSLKQIEKINRFIDIQNKGVICDLVWSDPSEKNLIQWEQNTMRGCSYYYSKIQAKKFLKQNKVKMIIRGHQVQIQGFNYQKSNNDQKLTLTIFSAPNYCDSYKNKGAVAIISDNKLSIERFIQSPHPFVLSNYMDCFEFTIPGICQLIGKILLYMLKNKRRTRRITNLIDDKILEELNAFQRIEFMNKLLQNQMLLNQLTLIGSENKQFSEDLKMSFEIATSAFTQKKQMDDEEKYPNECVLKSIKQRKNTAIMNLKMNKIKNNLGYLKTSMLFQTEGEEVFGPKISMKNQIKKLIFFQDQTQFIEEKTEERFSV